MSLMRLDCLQIVFVTCKVIHRGILQIILYVDNHWNVDFLDPYNLLLGGRRDGMLVIDFFLVVVVFIILTETTVIGKREP